MPLSSDLILENLKSVIDPEVGLNLVDMGLIYDVRAQQGKVTVEMTLTTPGCPMSSYLTQEVESVVSAMEGVEEVQVDLVWSPPWSPDKINPEAWEDLKSRSY